MHHADEFLKALATVLCVAAVTTVVFQRLRQPVVLGYLLAGLIVGPYVPIPLVTDRDTVQALSELGVILLMFSLGLEFRVAKLVKVGPTAGLTAIIECSLMLWLGFIAGQAFGWTVQESVFLGAVVAISSTTIIAKAFDEQNVTGKLRELVIGVLIVEDLVAVLLMAGLTAVSSSGGLSAEVLLQSSGRLLLFLAVVLAVGMLVVPRAMRAVVRLQRPETTLIAAVGLSFAVSLLALYFGYSVALGAFIAGSLAAESGEAHTIEQLVQPVRDMFAAIFFVSVGMLIEPALILRYWLPVAVITLIVIAGKVVGVGVGAFLTGNGVRRSLQSGMSLAQIGEFSFIIAGLGIGLNATGNFLYPVAVAVSAITALSTPWLIRWSDPVATYVDRKLPQPLQTYAALYGSWIEQIRSAPANRPERSVAARLARLLALDMAVAAAIIIAAALTADVAAKAIVRAAGVPAAPAYAAVFAAAVALMAPFGIGALRVTRALGQALARAAFPEAAAGKLDLAEAPRRALVVTLQLAIALLIGLPLVAITQPFLPRFSGAVLLLAGLTMLGFVFWRRATNLQGHVRAGAQMLVEALAMPAGREAHAPDPRVIDRVHALLPGLGEPTPVLLEAGSPAVSRTLAELNVRGLTGATVLAITRTGTGVMLPSAQERLQAGDMLAVAGTQEAVAAAIQLLRGTPPGPDT
jgi:CPA2 family monovalent cation:H+ antiporter-2